MIKRLTKILSFLLFLTVLVIFYLSLVGVKTEKFNDIITNKILKINKKINLDLKRVKFLLDPYNFTINITTKDPTVLLGGNKLKINSVKTNISLKSLIFKEFSIDDLQISTKSIKLDDLILLARSFKNSAELFLLNNVIKDGFLIAEIKIKFDGKGNIKDDYQITGFIKKAKLNLLNQIKTTNLNFEFDIQKKKIFFNER